MDVIGLLRSKNRCLEKFLDASRSFLDEAERGDFSKLAIFHDRRESILKAMALYDRKISEAVSLLPADKTDDPALIEAVRTLLDGKTALIHEILAVDERIVSRIEDEKSKVMKELAGTARSKDLMGKFKSGRGPSGEELDTKL